MQASIGSLRPARQVQLQSSFQGLTSSFQRLHVATEARQHCVRVVALRQCQLSGQKANNGWAVSFSHHRTHKLQGINLQFKRLFWPEQQRWVQLRITAKTLKTVEKNGLQATAKEAGVDLFKLPYTDMRPQRQEWLAQQPKNPPMNKDKIGHARRMKNPKKLAQSKKKPLQARYQVGNRVVLTRDPKLVEEYRN